MNSVADTNLAAYPTIIIYYSFILLLGIVLISISTKLASNTIIKRNSLNDRQVKKNMLFSFIFLTLGISFVAPIVMKLLETALFFLFF